MASCSRVLAPQRFTALPYGRDSSRGASRPSLRVQATAGERGIERQELILSAGAWARLHRGLGAKRCRLDVTESEIAADLKSLELMRKFSEQYAKR